MRTDDLMNLILQILESFNPGRISINQHAEAMINLFKSGQPEEAGTSEMETSEHSAKQTETQGRVVSGAKTGRTKAAASIKEKTTIASDDREFVLNTCCSIVGNLKLLNACCDLLYSRNGQLRPSLRNLFFVYFDFVIFQLTSEPFKKLKRLLAVQSPVVVMPFLRIVWGEARTSFAEQVINDGSTFQTTVKNIDHPAAISPDFKQILYQFFAQKFVDEDLTIAIVDKCLSQVQEYLKQLSTAFEQLNRSEQYQTAQLKSTIPAPFELTQKVLKTQTLEIVDCDVRATPMNIDLFLQTSDQYLQDQTEKIKALSAAPTVPDASASKFSQPPPKDPNRVVNVPEPELLFIPKKVEKETVLAKKEMKAEVKKTKLPSIDQNKPPALPVKQTKNEILREHALIQKQQQLEAQELINYEKGLHDSSEFDRWRAAVLEQDRKQHEAEVEIRIQQTKQLLANVVEASKVRHEQKQAQAQEFQAENLEQMLVLLEQDEQFLKERQEKAREQSESLQKQVKEAKETLLAEKRQVFVQHNEQLAELLTEAKDQRMIELAEKADLVKQIKAMLEVQSAERVEYMANRFDPSQTAGYQLLTEMSITELKERIRQMREFNMQLNEERRQRYQQQKEQEAKELAEKQREIELVRAALKQSRQIQRSTIKSNQKPQQLGIYQRLIDQVQIWASETTEKYQQDIQRQQMQREKDIKDAQSRKQSATSKVSELKQRLKEMKDKSQNTTRIFHENEDKKLRFTGTNHITEEGKKHLQNQAILNDKINRDLVRTTLKDENARKQAQKESEFNMKKEQTEQQLEQDLKVKQGTVNQEHLDHELRQRQLILNDQYKARASGLLKEDLYV